MSGRKISTWWSRITGRPEPGSGELRPSDIPPALKSAAEGKKKIFKDKTLVPANYEVFLAPVDYAKLKPFVPSLEEELVQEMDEYIHRKAYGTNGHGVVVKIAQAYTLKPGALEVAARFINGRKGTLCKPGVFAEAIRLTLLRGTPKERIIELKPGGRVLGRGGSADIITPADDLLVSKTHCELLLKDGTLYVRDLESANGTMINGRRISGVQTVAAGDRLQVGNTEIEVGF